jgi:hypothetical protein
MPRSIGRSPAPCRWLRQRRRCASWRRAHCPPVNPTRPTSSAPARCRRATTCTTSSTAWPGCACRRPSAASTNCRPRDRQRGVGGRRGPVRDALTLFDENGAVLQAPPVLWEALVARDWRRLFVDLRARCGRGAAPGFGHALLEKLATPRKGLTAHVWRFPPGAGQSIYRRRKAGRRHAGGAPGHQAVHPLPVLGVPGWWPQNENFSFYDDSRRVPSAQACDPRHAPSGPACRSA